MATTQAGGTWHLQPIPISHILFLSKFKIEQIWPISHYVEVSGQSGNLNSTSWDILHCICCLGWIPCGSSTTKNFVTKTLFEKLPTLHCFKQLMKNGGFQTTFRYFFTLVKLGIFCNSMHVPWCRFVVTTVVANWDGPAKTFPSVYHQSMTLWEKIRYH